MSLPQVFSLFSYWRRSPPVHELVAAFVGYEPPAEIAAAAVDGEFPMADFMASAAPFLQGG
jgi:hypothetical protein